MVFGGWFDKFRACLVKKKTIFISIYFQVYFFCLFIETKKNFFRRKQKRKIHQDYWIDSWV
jgi:hypothetical protein